MAARHPWPNEFPRQVVAVRVVSNLVSVTQDMKRALAFQNLLREVGSTWLIAELDISAKNVLVDDGLAFAGADAIKRPDNRVRPNQGIVPVIVSKVLVGLPGALRFSRIVAVHVRVLAFCVLERYGACDDHRAMAEMEADLLFKRIE